MATMENSKTIKKQENRTINIPQNGNGYGNGNGNGNGIDERLENYKKTALNNIRFSIIIKPALISFIALIISFFLDLSYVPVLGNISIKLASYLFPSWTPVTEVVTPFSFWWLPVVVYALFFFLAFLAYEKLKVEVKRTPTSETIDKILTSYTTIIDSIAMSLPLIGAAILLISIRLGEEVFLGLSVPFEVKALIILAVGKLFEPVIDQLGLEFQNVVNHVKGMSEQYYSKLQLKNSKDLISHINNGGGTVAPNSPHISKEELAIYQEALTSTSQLSEVILKNFSSIHVVLDKISKLPGFSGEKLEQLQNVANSISHASSSLSDEKTVTGLKYLESIVVKK